MSLMRWTVGLWLLHRRQVAYERRMFAGHLAFRWLMSVYANAPAMYDDEGNDIFAEKLADCYHVTHFGVWPDGSRPAYSS